MQEQTLEIINKLGLHARAATKLANTANKYSSNITITYSGKVIDAKSIMSLMLLAAAKGSVITVSAEGNDEQKAINDIAQLINNKFEEEE